MAKLRGDFICRAWVVAGATLLVGSVASAQMPAPKADPADFGLAIPSTGLVRQGEGRRVLLDDNRQPVVAQVLADVADQRIVILPSGRLRSLPIAETKATERAFVGSTREDLVRQLTAKTLPGFKNRKSEHYLFIYNCSDAFQTATRRILETMYAPVVENLKRRKFPVVKPQTPLVVIIFATEEQFQKYHPMPPGVVAYYSGVSNHVVLFEQSRLADAAPELAIKQAVATIAHEGIHQILHNIGVQQRLSRWPMWISEGLPEFYAPTSAAERWRWKGVGEPNDMRMYELEQALKSGSVNLRELVQQTVVAPRLSSTGYAVAWALTHYLEKAKHKNFYAYLAEVSKTQPFAEGALGAPSGLAADEALFVKHFGGDYQKLANGLLKHLKNQKYADPILNQTHYVATFDTSAQRSVSVTTSRVEAQKWQDANLNRVPPTLRARVSFQITPYPNRGTAEAAAKNWLAR